MEQCDICGGSFKNLKLHKQRAHEMDDPGNKSPGRESPGQGFNQIDPEQAKAFLEPMVVKAVQDTLSEMNVGEQLKQAASDSAKQQAQAVGNEIKEALPGIVKEQLTQMAQQAQGGGGNAENTPQPQGSDAQNVILNALAKKLAGGDSGGGLENLAKTMEMASNISNIFMKPYIEGQAAARREMNETLRMLQQAGATKEQSGQIASQGE